jgi:hypothetical protein
MITMIFGRSPVALLSASAAFGKMSNAAAIVRNAVFPRNVFPRNIEQNFRDAITMVEAMEGL